MVHGEKVGPREVVLFEGPQDGLLEIAAEDIRAALSMKSAWKQRVDAPVPLVELHNTDANMPLTDTEIEAVAARIVAEMAKRYGAVLRG